MHETALAISLVDLINDIAAREQAKAVTSATIEIGALSHVEAEALESAFHAAKISSLAAQARLEVLRTTGQARCIACGEEIQLQSRAAACPNCGSHQWLATGGDQMKLKYVEVV